MFAERRDPLTCAFTLRRIPSEGNCPTKRFGHFSQIALNRADDLTGGAECDHPTATHHLVRSPARPPDLCNHRFSECRKRRFLTKTGYQISVARLSPEH